MEDNFEKRFYVYIHKLEDEIVYIGSGTGFRFKSRHGRNEKHVEFFDSFVKEIVVDNLTDIEARDLEHEMITKENPKFNILKSNSKKKPIEYDIFSKLFVIDEDSPSLLSWIKNPNIHSNKVRLVSGRKVTSKQKGYYVVQVNGKQYKAHRILWSLYNRKDAETGYIIDHIDGNTLNNKESNLRACSYRENNTNKKKSARNTSGVTGVYIKLMKGAYFWTATWQDKNFVKRRKSFSISKYGNDKAFELAKQARATAIEELVKCGIKYSERHLNG